MTLYLLACLFMGLGIGLDVVLATFAKIRHLGPQVNDIWVRRITTTHVAFPMIGYYGFIEIFHFFPAARSALGIIAFSLIAVFLFGMLREWLQPENAQNAALPFSWLAVLSVSWDALFSGPAKSAQAIHWNGSEIFFSFFISGLVVSLLALLAVRVTLAFRGTANTLFRGSFAGVVRFQMAAMYLEFSIFAYFGMLALTRYSLPFHLPVWKVAAAAALLGAVLFLGIGKRVSAVLKGQLAANIAELKP